MAQVPFFDFLLLRGIESHDPVELGPCLGAMGIRELRGERGEEEHLYYRADDLPSFHASKH